MNIALFLSKLWESKGHSSMTLWFYQELKTKINVSYKQSEYNLQQSAVWLICACFRKTYLQSYTNSVQLLIYKYKKTLIYVYKNTQVYVS